MFLLDSEKKRFDLGKITVYFGKRDEMKTVVTFEEEAQSREQIVVRTLIVDMYTVRLLTKRFPLAGGGFLISIGRRITPPPTSGWAKKNFFLQSFFLEALQLIKRSSREKRRKKTISSPKGGVRSFGAACSFFSADPCVPPLGVSRASRWSEEALLWESDRSARTRYSSSSRKKSSFFYASAD